MTREEWVDYAYQELNVYDLLNICSENDLDTMSDIYTDSSDVSSVIEDWIRESLQNEYWYDMVDTLNDFKYTLENYDAWIWNGDLVGLDDESMQNIIENMSYDLESNGYFDEEDEDEPTDAERIAEIASYNIQECVIPEPSVSEEEVTEIVGLFDDCREAFSNMKTVRTVDGESEEVIILI